MNLIPKMSEGKNMVITRLAVGTHVYDKPTILKKKLNSAFENSPVKELVEVVFEKLSGQLTANKPVNLNKKVKTKGTMTDEDNKKKHSCMLPKRNNHQVFRHLNFERDADDRFICPLCKSSYKQTITLIRHLRYECGIEPQFQCTICSMRFRHKHNMMAHIAKIHGDNKKSKSAKRGHKIKKQNQITEDDETQPAEETHGYSKKTEVISVSENNSVKKHVEEFEKKVEAKETESCNNIQTLGEAFVQNNKQQNLFGQTMVITGLDGTHILDKPTISNETVIIHKDQRIVVTAPLNKEVNLSDGNLSVIHWEDV